jgi:hypothetical protein
MTTVIVTVVIVEVVESGIPAMASTASSLIAAYPWSYLSHTRGVPAVMAAACSAL